MGSRRKTTLTLDTDLLRATKIAAAREDKPEYQVIEDALRQHLGFDLIGRIQAQAEMDPEAALALALSETRAVRRARNKPHT